MSRVFDPTDFVSLHSADPGDSGANELSGRSYVRQSIAGLFSTPKNGQLASSQEISFDNLARANVTHIGFWDSKIGGRFLKGQALQTPKHLEEGDGIRFAEGKITVHVI